MRTAVGGRAGVWWLASRGDSEVVGAGRPAVGDACDDEEMDKGHGQ